MFSASQTHSEKLWRGHEWNCPQCQNACPRNFDTAGLTIGQIADYCIHTQFDGLCEEGAALKSAFVSSCDLDFLRRPVREFVPFDVEEKRLGKEFDPSRFILPETTGQQEFLAKLLTGSQAKTAFALRMNAEKLCHEGGVNSIGFLTLTVGDYFCPFHGKQVANEEFTSWEAGKKACHCSKCFREMNFCQVKDAAEASRRINNLNRRILPQVFEKAICVTERMRSGMIHFHLLGILRGRPDIRTGLNFDAIKNRDYRSASEQLRGLWAYFRNVLPGYGFGRAELLPIKKTGEAVASYVSKYIEKNVANRTEDDRRKKLVRYVGWNKEQLKTNEFEWNGEKSKAWRSKAREILGVVSCELPDLPVIPDERIKGFLIQAEHKIRPKMLDGTEAKTAFGPRWAFHINRIRACFDRSETDLSCIPDFYTREIVRRELFRCPAWCRKRENRKRQLGPEELNDHRFFFACQDFAEKYALALSGQCGLN